MSRETTLPSPEEEAEYRTLRRAWRANSLIPLRGAEALMDSLWAAGQPGDRRHILERLRASNTSCPRTPEQTLAILRRATELS